MRDEQGGFHHKCIACKRNAKPRIAGEADPKFWKDHHFRHCEEAGAASAQHKIPTKQPRPALAYAAGLLRRRREFAALLPLLAMTRRDAL